MANRGRGFTVAFRGESDGDVLGQGAFGYVQVVKKADNFKVARKCFKSARHGRAERQVLDLLEHPNIVNMLVCEIANN